MIIEQDPVRLAHVRTAEAVRPLHLPDQNAAATPSATSAENRSTRKGTRGRRRAAGGGHRVHDRDRRLDDRREQHEEPPEDRRMHQTGDKLLEELPLADDVDELPRRSRGDRPGSIGVIGAGGSQRRQPRRGSAPHERGRRRHGEEQQRGAQRPVRRRTSSVSAGSTVKRSPTTPRSAMRRIGASASLVIATMRREPFMPTACCSAPLMPAAM